MKQVLEIKTIQFITANQPQIIISPSHSRDNSTLHKHRPSDGLLKGSKIPNKRTLPRSNLHKRLSLQTNQSPNRPHDNPQMRCSTSQKRRCFTQGRNRYDQPTSDKFVKSCSMTKYEAKLAVDNHQMQQATKRKSHECSITKQHLEQMIFSRNGRIKSQPTNRMQGGLKEDLMARITKKINLMKKMTPELKQSPTLRLSGQAAESNGGLFKFDRLYDYCLKKINRCINSYEKDLSKNKDKKYYELKIQGNILSRELKQIRTSLLQKKQQEGDSMMGVIGNFMEIGKGERPSSQRATQSAYKKKLTKITKNMQTKNMFHPQCIRGWQFGLQKTQDFQL